MLTKLTLISRSSWYWLALVVIGLSFEAIALFYQHVLGEYPCVLCIHVRIWVLALIIVALAGIFVCRIRSLNALAHLSTIIVAFGLLDRAYRLLGTERGFYNGDCGFDLGLPAWFALDDWFPAIFKVETSCGYTPELLFGITMAEALIVISAVLVLVSVTMTSISVFKGSRSPETSD
jgi:disulfide bond formation protein DsbB